MARQFQFELFRLNIEDASDLFIDVLPKRLRGDGPIASVLEHATDPMHDQIQRTRTAIFKWSVREYQDLSTVSPNRNLIHLILARSVIERDGSIVTDEGMATGTSSLNPPLASTAVCIFDLSRHLVAIEHTAELSQTAWLEFFQRILSSSASSHEYWSSIALEPVPEKNGIIGLFRSFDRLTRMRVTLRIPNPELNRYTKLLYEDLSRSGIREITQDMKNPSGLAKDEDTRPFASAVLAEQGYKKGEVQFEGLRNGALERASSGSAAARGNVRGLRDFVRGLHANAKTKEAQRALIAITAEIDRLHPVYAQDE
ncbi:hypothetical protein C8C95_1803 [Acidovorax sp. 99]|uniref:hypothetical protein n=1 Tax=Acidovorax sp. 99 TaxID=2135634 RepID=UPI000D5CA8BD|nr:hypothetical protein [Acidovorax sp. 99]PVY90955.1 hypothetical protein C8C95_1803 [Acidovorax sp. 99]